MYVTLDVLDTGECIFKFALFIQMHGDDSLPQNKDTIYIDCIDSIKIQDLPCNVSPHTETFHELILAMLEYARRCGFLEFHLWARPPIAGPFLFKNKPKLPEGKFAPDEFMLSTYYWKICSVAQERGITPRKAQNYVKH